MNSYTNLGSDLGTSIPCQAKASKPASPCSSSVGMPGKFCMRGGLATPSTLSRPDFICGTTVEASISANDTAPAIRSVTAGAPPR